MSEEIKVHVVKAFSNGGQMVDPGDAITVSEDRARDLERNGLVERAEAKKAPAASNKMEAAHKNKAKGA